MLLYHVRAQSATPNREKVLTFTHNSGIVGFNKGGNPVSEAIHEPFVFVLLPLLYYDP